MALPPAVASVGFVPTLAITLVLGLRSEERLSLIETEPHFAVELSRDLRIGEISGVAWVR